MNIEICKWYGGKDSPVLFFVDDLANVWVDVNGNRKIDLGEDWGYARDSEVSSFRFLNEVILKDFPYVKTTFFTPMGIRDGMIENPHIESISEMINYDEEAKAFFRNINDNEKYEISYHGTTHGKAGKTGYDFIQEWKLFETLEEAIEKVGYGREVYKDVFGQYPNGGKYCGYSSNQFSDDSIDRSNFIWWCRFCNLSTIDVYNTDIYDKYIYGEDSNKITNFDIKVFGTSGVIDIPSTVNGGLLTCLFCESKKNLKSFLKKVFKKHLINKNLDKINFLLKNNLVISIQEHISPARNDGKVQEPNIFDDRESLRYIFDFLKDKNVWYCTGSELAQYYILRENAKINKMNDKCFTITYKPNRKFENKKISIRINKSNICIIDPEGNKIYENEGVFNIFIMNGLYRIMEV